MTETMSPRPPMTLTRLRELLDAYGADPDRWPAEERDAARALIAESSAARGYRDTAAKLDVVLDLATEAPATTALVERILAAASPQQEATPVLQANRQAPRRVLRLASVRSTGRAWRHARLWPMVVPLAAAVALVIWMARTTPVPESTGVTVAEIGVYDAPTDVLLATPDTGTFDSVPAFGCEGSGLGCIDTQPAGQQSTLNLEKFV